MQDDREHDRRAEDKRIGEIERKVDKLDYMVADVQRDISGIKSIFTKAIGGLGAVVVIVVAHIITNAHHFL